MKRFTYIVDILSWIHTARYTRARSIYETVGFVIGKASFHPSLCLTVLRTLNYCCTILHSIRHRNTIIIKGSIVIYRIQKMRSSSMF